MSRSALILTFAFALLAPATAGAEERVRPIGDFSELGTELLSDEHEITRFAHAVSRVTIRTRPTRASRSIGRLRYATESRSPEPYLVLRSRVTGGRVWLQIRAPARRNGLKGWVPRWALTELHVITTYLRIERKALRATLFKRGRRIWTSRIGIGAPGTPTPGGRYIVRERLRGDGEVYGPWAFGTSAYSRLSDWPGGGVIGLHGTNQPHLVPGRPSHGCIRIPNPKILQLRKLLPIGTPVRII